MAPASSTDFIAALRGLPLLTPDQQRELPTWQQRFPDSRALGEALIRHGWLTAFQANQVARGKSHQLVLGDYLVTDRLGEGGMGQVFKARHARLDRVVALKVLRPEMVADSESLNRFYREIQVAGQLPAHPNLIRAFDAGHCGEAHFLAMEYVPGTDLDRLVKQSGPLGIDQACAFIRQAALGLQHAHQHGLVHRDIKPSNLLVSSDSGSAGIVKILDLGLARLQSDSTNAARGKEFLTADGAVALGTVDYQAPEQALDFHGADIRADIYSLGCTFFFLLTGKAPFGDSPLAVKLMRHQQAKPPDLKECRPDVPAGLIPVVQRMLAKNPADRYQTPGEVAAALVEPYRPERRTRRRFLLPVAAGGAILCLLLFFLLRPTAPLLDTGKQAVETTKSLPPPAPDSVEATVPEAREYQLVYDLNLARLAKEIVYDEDRHAQITQPFDRIAHFIELRRQDGEVQYLYVSMAAFTTDIKKVGVPTLTSGATFQINVTNMNVYSNVNGIVTGTGITGGNIEFWPNNYGPGNARNVPNADSKTYDFGDQMTDPKDGYGSMQVHNHDAKQTLFAVNHWSAGGRADIGIGNNPSGNPDWTFMGNAGSYRSKRLRVLVRSR